ncbi:hypothetical protein [Nostoc sp. DedQUE07]|uniref:hypothetical protein n=1 Tax=Nostoc sp. DedQUE07 TaxID=3075392 RepID=UPI002AD23387|nr:hypothetical protein [Nostoc sp. DedQUE07]MDZ8131878.1 hypothetical protein [Nostoc sp. DedQUE07]
MKNEPVWTSVVTEISPGKFQLTVIDSNHCIFWHRRCFTTFDRAKNFSLKASHVIHNYEWLSGYGESLNWFFFEKFFIKACEEIIYRHWVISITELISDFHLELHDPWGFRVNLTPRSMDETTELEVLAECQRYIDSVEFSRHPVPGQLSLFEV